MNKVHLFIVDGQNDFCDPKGSLYVLGADKDMQRLSNMIDKIGDKIDAVHCSIDSHHRIQIFHPTFWKDRHGKPPAPFTQITVDDVENGSWIPVKPGLYRRALNYVQQLKKNNKYTLIVWPLHCLISTWGHCIYDKLNDSLQNWCEKQFATIEYITKGSSILTEHYSAIMADVPDNSDPTTQLNTNFLNMLNEADKILVGGEAKSHCVASTLKDIMDHFADPSIIKKLVLLEDATSNVPGFEALGEQFVKDAVARGMSLATTKSPL